MNNVVNEKMDEYKEFVKGREYFIGPSIVDKEKVYISAKLGLYINSISKDAWDKDKKITAIKNKYFNLIQSEISKTGDLEKFDGGFYWFTTETQLKQCPLLHL